MRTILKYKGHRPAVCTVRLFMADLPDPSRRDDPPPAKDPPNRKGPVGEPTSEQPVRRDPIPKGPDGRPKEVEDPTLPEQPEKVRV